MLTAFIELPRYRAEESGQIGIWVAGQETAGGIIVDE
jgi:hypothetical protein